MFSPFTYQWFSKSEGFAIQFFCDIMLCKCKVYCLCAPTALQVFDEMSFPCYPIVGIRRLFSCYYSMVCPHCFNI